MTMLDLRHVEAFVGVVTTGSFHAAATRIGRSQPTLSQQIQKLEKQVGAALIVRSVSGCRPTQAGTALLPYARTLLRVAGQAIESARTRRISIGASGNIGTYLLQESVARFATLGHPMPEIVIAPNPILTERLGSGELDLALMEWWSAKPGLTATIWRREEMFVIVAMTHPWARRTAIDPEELVGQPIIGGERGTGTGQLLRMVVGPIADTLRMAFTLGSTEAVKRAVMAGLGISVVIASAVESEVAAGLLHAIRLKDVPLCKDLFAAHATDLEGASPVNDFVKLIAGPATTSVKA